MLGMSDDSSRLPEAQICEINGVSQQYRQTLVRRGLVRQAPKGGCTLGDALELAAIKVLSDMLGAGDVALAAQQLGSLFGEVVLGKRLDVVYDRQYKRVDIARSDAELRALVIHGRPANVLSLAERFEEVGDAFRRIAALGDSRRRVGGARGARRGRRRSPRRDG
jgi:hypothetical protein